MRIECLRVAETIGDLAGMPVGTRIATSHNKILERDEAWGREYWIEPGTLSPYFEPLVHWLPCVVLPRLEDRPKVSVKDYRLADLQHAGLIKAGDVLTSSRRDSVPAEATVGEDGRLIVGGESYDSPSGAALATLRHRIDGINGWVIWRDKEGRFLTELRRIALEQHEAP